MSGLLAGRIFAGQGSNVPAVGALVLCYHAVSDRWPAALSTTPERLERQLRLLAGRGYRATTFTELAQADPRERLLAVTFDDAYSSVYAHARPILDRLGMPATVFVPTDYIGRDPLLCWQGIDQWFGGPHEHELAPMSWDQLRGLAAEGWEIGSHSGSHPRLTQLTGEQLDGELRRSRSACERELGRPCRSLAYPYGDVDDRVVAAAARAGYAAAATLPRRLERGDALRIARIGIYHADDDRRFQIKLSRPVLALRRSPAWDLADGLRREVNR